MSVKENIKTVTDLVGYSVVAAKASKLIVIWDNWETLHLFSVEGKRLTWVDTRAVRFGASPKASSSFWARTSGEDYLAEYVNSHPSI